MRVERNPWGTRGVALVEWRAGNIRDPIARLRFLRQSAAARARRPRPPRARAAALLAVALAALLQTTSDATVRPKPAGPLPRPVAAEDFRSPGIWLVERTKDDEAYSNGLRIDNRFSVANHARSYTPLDRNHPDVRPSQPSSAPAGIVFHTTESFQAPFEPSQNRVLRTVGESLLGYVRNRRAYHFVIDRFGRVHRIVQESDAANHAGRSVWADADRIYLNLNSSFLGVAFEAQSQGGGETIWANPAQTHAARILTEMLRSKYRIPAGNCVTHVQVSVNPDNMQVGYHTDFGQRFAFAEIGLADNYARPLPSICLFGFQYDPSFLKATGAPLWTAVALSEEQLRAEALARGFSVPDYRRRLQNRYRTLISKFTHGKRLETQDE